MPETAPPDGSNAGQPWTAQERAAVVMLYVRMLDLHVRGEQVRQTELFREFASKYPARNVNSIKNKIYNVSACFAALELPYLQNLTPRFNFQSALLDDVQRAAIENRLLLEELASLTRQTTGAAELGNVDLAGLHVDPPQLDAAGKRFMREVATRRTPIDYLAREQSNRELGLAGEKWVCAFERRQLIAVGRHDLAQSVRHVAAMDGDGCGYDIRSFTPHNGAERWIEVKTTRSGILTPFYLTRNEFEVSKGSPDRFSLYRVHCFGARTRVYWLDGALDASCVVTAQTYRALPRSRTA